MKDINILNTQVKIEEAIRLSLPMLPEETKAQVKAALSQEKLDIIAASMFVRAEYAKLKLSVTRGARVLSHLLKNSSLW